MQRKWPLFQGELVICVYKKELVEVELVPSTVFCIDRVIVSIVLCELFSHTTHDFRIISVPEPSVWKLSLVNLRQENTSW